MRDFVFKGIVIIGTLAFFSWMYSKYMASEMTIGLMSGLLVTASSVPYIVRVAQGKIQTSLTGWSLWTVIGLLLLLTYKNTGAGDNFWPALFGFTNPLMITGVTIWNRGQFTRPDKYEQLCIVFGLLTILLWWRSLYDLQIAPYALYLAIIADLCAAVPTFRWVCANPHLDRPFSWYLFALGYFVSMFAITEEHRTIENYALPIYMVVVGSIIGVPLVWHRVRNNVPLTEWI